MRLQVNQLQVNVRKRTLLQDISFSVADGDWLMLCGMNGSGKSTLLRAIIGAIASRGTVLLDGEYLKQMRPMLRARRVGLLSAQHTMEYAFTVEEIVSMGRYAYGSGVSGKGDAHGTEAMQEALRLTGMTELRTQSMLTLSSGERQRAFLAQVLCQEPDLLLLDEPASHLDLTYAHQLYEMIDDWRKQPGRAVISVEHDLSIAKYYGTRALLLDHGRQIAFGAPEQVLSDGSIRQAWRIDAADWLRNLSSVWK